MNSTGSDAVASDSASSAGTAAGVGSGVPERRRSAPREIAIEIDRPDVTVEDFVAAINALLGIVGSVKTAMYGDAKVTWIIRAMRSGSAALVAEASSAFITPSMLDRVLARTGGGLASLQRSKKRPVGFSDTAIEQAAQLAAIAIRSNAGSARLRLGSHEVTPTETFRANARQLIAARQKSLGEIDGILEQVASKDGYEIWIQDRLHGRRVKCTLPRNMLPKALRNFERRVRVQGTIWWREDGIPSRMEVSDMIAVRDDAHLPSTDEMRGLLAREGR